MATEIKNDAGDTVAISYYGGINRGPLADVLMPKSVAEMVSSMPVFAEQSPDLRTTLGEWIKDQTFDHRRVRYDHDIRLNLR